MNRPEIHKQPREKSAATKIYASARWRRVSLFGLRREPLCCDPFKDHEREGITVKAAHRHHIIKLIDRPDLAFVPSNCQSVCKSCHARLDKPVHGSQKV